MSIYTKRGDKGETGLFRKVKGKSVRVLKSSCNTRAIGAIDEIDSYIGIIISISHDEDLKTRLSAVQNNLLCIGSILAGAHLKVSVVETKKLEKEIDIIDRKLPKLTNFIFPGGCLISAHLQFARTLVRRAEREVVALNEEDKISPTILKYLNRLSDYLFVLARWVNYKKKVREKKWT